jgi:hypothetical protein
MSIPADTPLGDRHRSETAERLEGEPMAGRAPTLQQARGGEDQ